MPKKKVVEPLPIQPIYRVRLQAIKDVDKYITKRAYWYMMALEKKIMVDPTSVKPDDYMQAVKNYTEGMRKYEATYEGMDKKRINHGDSKPGRSGGIGKNRSADMGAGVPTPNPIT